MFYSKRSRITSLQTRHLIQMQMSADPRNKMTINQQPLYQHHYCSYRYLPRATRRREHSSASVDQWWCQLCGFAAARPLPEILEQIISTSFPLNCKELRCDNLRRTLNQVWRQILSQVKVWWWWTESGREMFCFPNYNCSNFAGKYKYDSFSMNDILQSMQFSLLKWSFKIHMSKSFCKEGDLINILWMSSGNTWKMIFFLAMLQPCYSSCNVWSRELFLSCMYAVQITNFHFGSDLR